HHRSEQDDELEVAMVDPHNTGQAHQEREVRCQDDHNADDAEYHAADDQQTADAVGRVHLGRTRDWVLPKAERIGFGPARWWDLEAEPGQVLAGCFGRDPALRRSIEEAEPQQERLVDVLDRLDLLGEDGTQGRDADWPRTELLDD